MGIHRVRRLRRVLAGLVALTAAAAYASAAPVSLRFEPKVGEDRRYKLLISARTLESAPGQEGTSSESRTEVSADLEYVRKVLSAAENRTKIETRLLNGVATVEFGEGKATVHLPPFGRVSEVDRRGQVISTEEDHDAEAGTCWEKHPYRVPEALLHLGISCGIWAAYPDRLVLPEGEVEVGSTWTHEEDLAQGSKQSRTFTLEDFTTLSGHKCAKIRERWRGRYTHTEGPDGGEVPPGQQPTRESEQTSSGELLWYYDYERSVVVRAEGSLASEVHQKLMAVQGETDSGQVYYISPYESTTKSLKNLKITLLE